MIRKKSFDSNKKTYRYELIAIIVFAFLLYANIINNRYSLDDEFVIFNNEKVHKGISGIPHIFSTFYYSDEHGKTFGYRPVAQSTFAIEYSVFGENPSLSHFINIILYIITCVLLFRILKILLAKYNPLLPFVITILFVAHPVHTEVVASLKNREELLSFLGSMASLLFFLRYYKGKHFINIFYGLFFYVFAYLSKETALVFIAVIPLTLYFFSEFSFKKLFLIFTLLLSAGIITRYMVNSGLPVNYSTVFFENPLVFNNKLLIKLSTGMYVLGFYLKILIFPHPLLFYYGYNMIPVEEFGLYPALLLLLHLALFIYAITGLKKKKIISYGILYYLICISIFSNIIMPVNGIVGERLVFFASLGFVIVLGHLILKLSKITDKTYSKKSIKKLIIITLIIIIPYSAKTISRNNDWYDHYTLYSSDIDYLENSAKANELTGNWLYEHLNDISPSEQKKAIPKIRKYYLQSLKIFPENSQVTNNLGSLYLTHIKNLDSAIIYFNKCLKIDSSYTRAHFNIAQCYQLKRQDSLAIYHYESVLKYDSSYVKAINKLSIIYGIKGKYKKAIKLNKKLINLNPSSPVPYYNLANIYVLMGDTLKGLEYAEKSLNLNPANVMLALNTAQFYKLLGNIEKAKFYYNLAEKYNTKKQK